MGDQIVGSFLLRLERALVDAAGAAIDRDGDPLVVGATGDSQSPLFRVDREGGAPHHADDAELSGDDGGV